MSGFPPQDITAFLICCAGEWLALRSRLAIGEQREDDNDDEWHDAERGELKVNYLEPDPPSGPGGLVVQAPNGSSQRLIFEADGLFRSGEREGRWCLWPDGSLELTLEDGDAERRERIWFTKPNLRLRSTVEHRADGSPGRASFSSEIRRLPPPPAADA